MYIEDNNQSVRFEKTGIISDRIDYYVITLYISVGAYVMHIIGFLKKIKVRMYPTYLFGGYEPSKELMRSSLISPKISGHLSHFPCSRASQYPPM